MSDQDDELWLLFVEDGTRAIDDSDQGLLDLEQRPEAKESIDAIYRAMHSFKGNARALGLRNLERFAHKAEDLAAIIRERGRLDQPILLEALLEATEQTPRLSGPHQPASKRHRGRPRQGRRAEVEQSARGGGGHQR